MPFSNPPASRPEAKNCSARLEIGVGDRPAERLARELRENLSRARQLLGLVGRPASEKPLPARRIADAGRIDRPVDLQPLYFERTLLALDDPDFAAARNERLQHGIGFRERARDERCGDVVRAGRHRHANALEPRVDFGHGRGLPSVHGREVFGPADLVRVHLHAVDCDDQPVPVLEAFDVARTREPAERDLVGAVRREEVLDEHSAARAERHAGAVKVLVQPGLGVEHAAVHASRAGCRPPSR